MNKIPAPNYTQTPNQIFEEFLPLMGVAELKVVLAIVRNTFGWHRKSHRMSLSYFTQATGLSRQGVLDGLNAGIQRGIICRHKMGQSYEYSLRIDDETSQATRPVEDETSQASRPVEDETSQASRPVLVKLLDPTKKDKERTTKESDGGGGSFPDGVSFAEVVQVYQSEIGMYSMVVADMMQDDFDTYGGKWIIDAIHIAVLANKRKYNYVRGILRRWHTDGRQDDTQSTTNATATVMVTISGGDM